MGGGGGADVAPPEVAARWSHLNASPAGSITD